MLTPGTEAEVAEAVASAAGPLRIIGGGTRPLGRPATGEVLSVAGLSGVTLYEPGALTLVAQAGTPLAEVEAALAQEGQRLAFEPMDHRDVLGTEGAPTIGGVVAANVSGPRRVMAGACRDFMLGVRFVDGMGTVVKNGGRVMKNVTGYDLVKLMTGAYGTLGVLTEVALKVLPQPEVEATLVLPGLDLGAAVSVMAAALGSPFEVSGAAYVPGSSEGAGVLLRLEGFAEQVTYRTGALQALMAAHGDMTVIEGADSAKAWAAVRDVTHWAGQDGDIWRISVKPSAAPGLVEQIEGHVMLDWGGGLIWAQVAEGTDLRARLGAFDGHATLVRASEATRAQVPPFSPQGGAVAALSAGVKAKFDPRGLLNPGMMD